VEYYQYYQENPKFQITSSAFLRFNGQNDGWGLWPFGTPALRRSFDMGSVTTTERRKLEAISRLLEVFHYKKME
jgi:hypothetical protein